MDKHVHKLNAMTMICDGCGMTAEYIAMGRDVPATWNDVDVAQKEGFEQGYKFAKVEFRSRRRRKLIQVGAYLQLRRMKSQLSNRG